MGAAAIRWSQFEVALSRFVNGLGENVIETKLSTQLEQFPKTVNGDFTPNHISAEIIASMVDFYKTFIVEPHQAVNMGPKFFNKSDPVSIFALERFRTHMVKTNTQQSASTQNAKLLSELDTPTHYTYKKVNGVQMEKRQAPVELSERRIAFSLAMQLLRKFFKALKVVQRYNGSSLMTVEGLMQATYALPYKEEHQFTAVLFSGSLEEGKSKPIVDLGGLKVIPRNNPWWWQTNQEALTPFGDHVRNRVVTAYGKGALVNIAPWAAASDAAVTYKRKGAGAISEAQKHQSVANTVSVEALKQDQPIVSSRQTIADQIAFLALTSERGSALAQIYATKHVSEIRNMIGVLMIIYCTSTHKGISDFEIHRLIKQMYNYEQATIAFLKTVFTAELGSDLKIFDSWKIDIPPPRKFEKFKKSTADDTDVAKVTAYVARP